MICKSVRTSVNWQLTQVLHRSGCSEPRKTGAADRIPGASVGEARTEEQAAVRGEDRKESRSRCDLVKEARKKEGALTICGEARQEHARKEQPVRRGAEASWHLGLWTTRRRRARLAEAGQPP